MTDNSIHTTNRNNKSKQQEHYDETVAALVEAAKPEYHLDAWQLS